jgi:hypothetical protein
MLREIGLATPVLIILVAIAIVVVLRLTTEFGVFSAGTFGVTSETALSWGQTETGAVPEGLEIESTEETAD